MRQQRARNSSGNVKDASKTKSEKIYKLAPIMTLQTDGSTIYGRLSADVLKDGIFKSYAPIAYVKTDVPFLDADGKQQTGFDIVDKDGNSFLEYPQLTLHKAVLYASRKFVSSEVSRLFPVDSEKQTYKQQLDQAAVLKQVYRAIVRKDFSGITADMLKAVESELDADELKLATAGIKAGSK